MRHPLLRALVLGGLAALPLLPACSDERTEANVPAAAPRAEVAGAAAPVVPVGLARADFDVRGMDCGGCVIGTRAALRKLEGVQQADASYDDATGKGTAWALYDPAKVTPERLMTAIRELGYTPALVPSQS
ncbi:MAG: cation transporter [Gemmatimonadota bacterium]|nr:cation transporter [Gemmatimonadota bacterium]